MMKLRVMAAQLACRMARFGLRLLGRGGTDLPGKIALKICPKLLDVLAKNVTTIIVTGTNGKTTTARMIEQALADNGISYFSNKSGANLLSGITAEFSMNSTLTGKNRHDFAVIECDEGAFKLVGPRVDAKCVVVTNVFRDQLDRYGEVTGTLQSILIGIQKSPNAVLCLNADDSLTRSLAEEVENKVVFYGVNVPVYASRVQEVSDAPYCIHCKHEYEYAYVTYGHLGGYRCPNCGYARPEPQVAVSKVIVSDAEHSELEFTVGGKTYAANVNLPGGYNIYNACSAMAVGEVFGLNPAIVAKSLSDFECGFGRMERFEIEDHKVRMILIKNPAGCNQVLNFLSNVSEPALFVVCLSDHTQDGKDISWIWDVDFEKLLDMGDKLSGIYVSGPRAEDMAVRFKYAGIPMQKLKVIKDHAALMRACLDQPNNVYIMPTYTAMLSLRGYISKAFGFKQFWE